MQDRGYDSLIERQKDYEIKVGDFIIGFEYRIKRVSGKPDHVVGAQAHGRVGKVSHVGYQNTVVEFGSGMEEVIYPTEWLNRQALNRDMSDLNFLAKDENIGKHIEELNPNGYNTNQIQQ